MGDPGWGDLGHRLSTGSLARDERTDFFDAPRVEHVLGFDPPRRAVPTPNRIWRASHSARWQSLSIAIVTRRRRTACDGAVHVEMAGRAVDFHRGSGFGRCVKQRVEVEIETG
jgi:hypothetical protein